MWLSSIVKTQALQRLKELSRELRAVALVLIGLVCANLFIYAVLIVPAAARLKTDEARYIELRRKHAETVLFKKQKPALAGIMAGIPTQKDMPLLIKQLVQTARRQKLSVAPITYDIPKRAPGETVMLVFSFSTEGRYPDIKRFIYDVETAGSLVGIRDIKFGSDKGRVKMDMKLVTYIKG